MWCSDSGVSCGAVHRKKERVQSRVQGRQRGVDVLGGGVDELMDTPTFKRFSCALDGILDSAEDLNLKDIRGKPTNHQCTCARFFPSSF